MSQSDRVLTITAHTTAPTASCPPCGESSPRLHSDYTRRPRDLPRWEYTVRVVLHVRRFRCLNASCTARTCAARLPPVVRPAAQRPVRWTTALQQLGLARGGEAGARLGAPEAQQVLGRWHLVRHLREALARRLDRLHQRLAALLTASQTTTALTPSSAARALHRSTHDQSARQERRARRLARYEPVRALDAPRVSKRPMARPLRRSRTPVSRYLRPDACPARAPSRRASRLDPYVASLPTRGEAGWHHGVHLWREMQALGFAGTRRMVSHWVGLRRELALGRPSTYGRRPALPKERAIRLRPALAAGGERSLPAPRPLVWGL